ncbi:MAG: DUF4493 domain-containing protein [Bacteroidaceae bacterium]|nr:DUF4493 domain-containing protein [Bacteroidaceae bacterium]
MKLNKIYFFAAMTALAFTACDNSEPWLGKSEQQQGELKLTVKGDTPATRASVDTKDFAVEITGKGDLSKVIRQYETVAQLPASITLPVGFYDVEAHSPGELLKEMDAPYYKGSKEVEVTKVPTNTEIKCRMANSKIQVNYDPDFKTKFVAWNATINDGSEHVLTFNEWTSKTLWYWWFNQPTKEILVDIEAKTNTGEMVKGSLTLTKRNSAESYPELETEYFTGGDAIIINMKPATDDNGYISGIVVDARIEFTNYDEDVVIEVKDDEEEPGPGPQPGEDIVITTIPTTGKVSATLKQTTALPDVQYDFEFPTGLKNLYVKVSSDNSDFMFATSLMGLTSGDGLDLTSSEASVLAALFPLPTVGDKTYQFSLNSAIWDLLVNEPGYEGVHVFTLKAVDKNGKTKSGELEITITK